MLTKTMSKIKNDFKDMEKFIYDNCNSPTAYKDILGVIAMAKEDLLVIDSNIVLGKFSAVLEKIADHVMPRKDKFYIRKNYDYGELWPTVLDEFRKGKIKNVVDMARKLRRWPDGKKKANAESGELHLDSYCDKKENIDYWSGAAGEDDEHNKAVQDFINYIKENKC